MYAAKSEIWKSRLKLKAKASWSSTGRCLNKSLALEAFPRQRAVPAPVDIRQYPLAWSSIFWGSLISGGSAQML